MIETGSYSALKLLPQHAKLLAASAIAPEVAKERGYWSATKKVQLKDLGFSDLQCRVPALVVPIFDVTGKVALHQIRPDKPRAGTNGKLTKYETPKGARIALDIPSGARPFLGTPDRPLFITEGVKKADSAVSHGLCGIALLGVWNFRGGNDEGGKTILAAWEYIDLKGREVYIVFDSDVSLKPEVYRALVRLKAFPESRGALVRVIYLDPKQDGSKVGLDDFFVAGGKVTTLLAQAENKLRNGPVETPEFPYVETPLGLLWKKPTREGTVDVPLCNFTARIVTECEEDDGVETRRTFDIAVAQGERTATVRIPWERFNAVNWPIEALGADAAIVPGPMARDHIRFATQLFSKGAPRRKVYTHIGWRKVEQAWVYLHADGAIGTSTEIEVAAPAALDRYRLPHPPERDERVQAVRASLRMLDVAPRTVSVPPYCAVWRALFGDTDFSLHLTGPTGEGKSELAALALQHHGAGLDVRHLPASWSSTGNSLEGLAFAAKDALLVIDDFCPTGSTADIQRYHREADRVGRAQGNASGRQRMRADGTLRSGKPPRGLILSTGEDIPRGHSLRARTLVDEVSPGDVRWATLTFYQRNAAAGLYAQSLAAFLHWVAPRYEALRAEVKKTAIELRDQVPAHHRRTPDSVANLAAGFFLFLRFATEIEAISTEEKDTLLTEVWRALCDTAGAQAQHHADSDPVARCIDLLVSIVASGRGHLAAINGGDPEDAERWGWEARSTGYGAEEHQTMTAKGKKFGWVTESDLFLDPDSSFAAIQEMAHVQGDAFPITQRTLHKRLAERGILTSTGAMEGRETLKVRRDIEGARRQVLHLRKSILVEGLSPYKKPDQPDQSPTNGTPPPNSAPDNAEKPDHGQVAGQVIKPDLTRENGAKSDTFGSSVRLVRSDVGGESLDQGNKNGPIFSSQVGQVRSDFSDRENLTNDEEEAEWER